MTFDSDLSDFGRVDPSGPPSPIGGGLGVFVFDDGVEVTNMFGEPAWGGLAIRLGTSQRPAVRKFMKFASWGLVFHQRRS